MMMTSAFAYAGSWRPKREPFHGRCLVNGVPYPINPNGVVTLNQAHALGAIVEITYLHDGKRR